MYADPNARHVYEPHAPLVWSQAGIKLPVAFLSPLHPCAPAKDDPNAYGRFGLRHASVSAQGQVEPAGRTSAHVPQSPAHGAIWRVDRKTGAVLEGTGKYNKECYSPSPAVARCVQKASQVYSHENARQAVVWGLQAQGVKPSQIEEKAAAVVEAAAELGELDEHLNRTGHCRSSDLHAEGKFKQQARLRRVLCKGVTGQVESSVSKLGDDHGLRGAQPQRCGSVTHCIAA